MPEEETKKTESKKAESNAQLILKALQMKSVKTIDDVAKKVVEQKPDAVESKIKGQCKLMIKEIVAGKGSKAKTYKWDEENFLLTKVE